MSTIEEFEAAPAGATATRVWKRAVKTFYSETDRNWLSRDGEWLSAQELVEGDWALDPSPVPTSAREALDLAWELAPPVKEGDVIPKGTRLITRYEDGFVARRAVVDITVGLLAPQVRTLDPLPEPEPDWLDAPAVLASTAFCDDRNVWEPAEDGMWACVRGDHMDWQGLRDVTPLYPKEDS